MKVMYCRAFSSYFISNFNFISIFQGDRQKGAVPELPARAGVGDDGPAWHPSPWVSKMVILQYIIYILIIFYPL